MKKLVLTGMLAMFIGTAAIAQSNTQNLPQNAQDFISKHFSSETIEKMEEEKGWFDWDKNEMYEVFLANGVRIDFNKQGEPTEITTRKGAKLPEAAFPAKILNYMKQHYSGTAIVSWEKDDNKQEVGLEDGREFEFASNGDFIKED